jgi:hypothetical protein
MTNTTMSARFAESDFRVGPVITRSATILSQHFLIFFLIGVVANLPSLVVGLNGQSFTPGQAVSSERIVLLIVSGVLSYVLSMISQAVMLHASFQAMRMRPVNVGESLRVGLSRVIWVILLALLTGILAGLASLLLVVPGLILITMWWVAIPACVVERTGPWTSMKRSAALTKGHRWKVFGLLLLLIVGMGLIAGLLQLVLAQVGSQILVLLGTLLFGAITTAYYSIAVVMTYHDLRVAKEGIDIEQIASVFD